MDSIIVVPNFITKKDSEIGIRVLSDLVEERAASSSVRGSGAGIPGAVPQGARSIFVRPLDSEAIRLVKEYGKKINELLLPEKLYVHDVIFVKYGPGAFMDPHMDFIEEPTCADCKYSSVVYFDDDYDGGEIYFPNINKSYHPSAGSMVLFPQSDERYMHGVKEVQSGFRHMMNLCHTINPEKMYEIYK